MMNQNTLTIVALLHSFAVAESRYLATNPTDKAGNPLTASADLKKARKFVDAQVCDHVAGLFEKGSIDAGEYLSAVETRLPMKAIMRSAEFFAALTAKNYKLLDRETALVIVGAVCAGAVTREANAFCATGKGNEHTSDVVRDQSLVNKVRNALGAIGVSTEQTQHSRSFGSNGFCALLGMGSMVKVQGASRSIDGINGKSPFVRAVLSMLETASEQTLKVNMGKREKGAK